VEKRFGKGAFVKGEKGKDLSARLQLRGEEGQLVAIDRKAGFWGKSGKSPNSGRVVLKGESRRILQKYVTEKEEIPNGR